MTEVAGCSGTDSPLTKGRRLVGHRRLPLSCESLTGRLVLPRAKLRSKPQEVMRARSLMTCCVIEWCARLAAKLVIPAPVRCLRQAP